MSDLSGTKGLIVGVANQRSLSWAIAKAADEAGAKLTLSYANERFGEKTKALAETLSQPAQLVPCNVTNDQEIDALYQAVEAEHGSLDFLVHGVAFASRKALAEPFTLTKREDFRQSLDVSVYSLIALARGAAPLMKRNGGGSILTLTYLGSERVFPHYNVMGVAKAALESTIRYIAEDLGPLNIRANAISAGPIKTLAASGIGGFTKILQHYRDHSPLRRTVDAGEVADAATFLLSSRSRGITGEVLMVDAGYNITGM